LFPVTIVMDAGIATEENIEYITSQWYYYVAVKRSTKVEKDASQWDYQLVKEIKTITGKVTNSIEIRRNVTKWEILLECKSEKKNLKEDSMMMRLEQSFETKLQALQKSIVWWTIKLAKKIHNKIWQLQWSHKRLANYYIITYDEKKQTLERKIDKAEKTKTQEKREKYVLRTNNITLTDEEIRDTYNTIRRIEDTFRTMKTDLRLRPIHHQHEKYTVVHIFLTVLAYHIVNIILFKLQKKKINIRWSNILEDMITQTRWTVTYQTIQWWKKHIRVTDLATEQQNIYYAALEIQNHPLQNTMLNK
jgi:transposase